MTRTPRGQDAVERLLQWSLAGMNCGGGGLPARSGEEHFIKTIVAPWFQESETKIAFDVGASDGEYTRLLHAYLPDGSSIYSFEPQASAYDLLLRTISEKGIQNSRPFRLAFSDQPGRRKLFSNRKGSVLASFYERRLDFLGIQMDQHEEVQVDSIDCFCEQHEIPAIDLLKLDTEGHELAILHGAKELFGKGRVAIVQWEFGGCNIDARNYFRDFYYLMSDEYKICRLLPCGLRPLREYREIYEIFLTTNWCGISKRLFEFPRFKRIVSRLYPWLL